MYRDFITRADVRLCSLEARTATPCDFSSCNERRVGAKETKTTEPKIRHRKSQTAGRILNGTLSSFKRKARAEILARCFPEAATTSPDFPSRATLGGPLPPPLRLAAKAVVRWNGGEGDQ